MGLLRRHEPAPGEVRDRYLIIPIAQSLLRELCMREWQCVLVGNHKDIGKTIEEYEKNDWQLHTYACAGNAALALGTNHYLLFERGSRE